MIRKILIACSASDYELLQQPECRVDATRYAMVGAFVLLTACFAFASGTFALYTGFGSLPIALVVGVLWALMIFTIDRFVVSGIRKADVEGLSPKERIWIHIQEWLVAAPRIALAAVISFVVATPIEIRFFEREIDAQIQRNDLANFKIDKEAIEHQFAEIDELRAQVAARQKEIDSAHGAYLSAYETAVQERAGEGVTRREGPGPIYLERLAQSGQREAAWHETARRNGPEIESKQRRINQLTAQRDKKLREFEERITKSDGFLARYHALSQLATIHPDIGAVKHFMTFLFLVLELTPVLMKLMLRRGPYDDLVDTLEHETYVAQLMKRSHQNDNIHTEVAIHTTKNSKLIELQERLSEEAYKYETILRVAPNEIAQAQQQIADASIDLWLSTQKQRVGTPPLRPVASRRSKPAAKSPRRPVSSARPATTP